MPFQGPLFPTKPTSALDEFAFYGFDDPLGEVERRLRRLTIRRGEPELTTHEAAVFVPTQNRRFGPETKVTGSLLEADGRPIANAQASRRGRALATVGDGPLAPPPPDEVREEVVYLGPLYNHFGRFLLDSLARIWALPQLDPSTKVLFDYPNSSHWQLHPWVFRILEAFGVPRARILTLEAPTRLRRVTVPEPLFEQAHGAHERAIEPFRQVAARITGDIEPSSRPVYLSRRLLTSRQRPLIGEAALEQLLSDYGVRIVHPQTLAFEEQIRLVNGHSDILSSPGSAAHNILFALHRPRLHLLTAGNHIPANFFLCSALAGAPTSFVDCLGTGGRPSFEEGRTGGRRGTHRSERKDAAFAAPGGQATPQLVDLRKVAEYVGGHGGGGEPRSLPPTDPDPALENEYAEAWLYAFVRRTGSNRGARLPTEIEDEARALASESWPLNWILARYYAIARQESEHASPMIDRFVDLVSAETDQQRLAYHWDDVVAMADRIARWAEPATAVRLRRVVAERFRLAPDSDQSTTDEPLG